MKQEIKYRDLKKPASFSGKKTKGQVVVEYILLLVVSVLIATLLIAFVDESRGGKLFEKWRKLLTVIGEDIST